MKKQLIVIIALVLVAGAALAGNLYWSGDGSSQGGAGTWDTTTARWGASAGGPFGTFWNNGNNDTAIFGGTAGTVTLGTGISVGGLTFSDSVGYNITANTVTFGAAGTITANYDATIAAILDGNVQINKAGTGKLTLQTASTRTGATVIDAGTLRIESDTAFGTTAAPITINNGSTLEVATTTTLGTGAGTITLNNGGTISNGMNSGSARFDKTINIEASATAVVTFNSGINSAHTLTINGGGNSRLAGGAAGAKIQIKGSGKVDVGDGGNTRTTAVIADWYLQGGKLNIRWDTEIGNAANDFYFEGGTLSLGSSAFTLGASRVLDFSHAAGGTVDTASQSFTLSTANQLVGANTLTKTGGYSLIISADSSSTFSGDINVTAGTLQLNSPAALHANSDVTVTNGATLLSDGTINGTVTATECFLSPGASAGAIGTLTLANNSASALTLNRSGILSDLPASGTTCDLIAITGNLVLNGMNTIYPNAPGGAAAGTYTLMTYAAKTGSGSIVFPNGSTTMGNLTLTAGATSLTLTVAAGGINASIWKGTVDGNWDTATLNWTRNGAASQAYVEGDDVTIEDTATATTLTNAVSVSPASVTVNNSTKNFTVSATIGGSGPVTKLGSGTLTLSGTNTYTGGTVISEGTLSISKDENLGATNGTLTINGATVALTATTWLTNSRPVVLNSGLCAVRQGGNASFNITGPVSGAGGIWYKTTSAGGNGFRLLSLTNTFTGELGLDTSTDRCSLYLASLADSPGCGNIWFNPGGNKNTFFYWDASATNALVLNNRRVEVRGGDAPQWMIQNDNATYPIIVNTDFLVTGTGTKTLQFNAASNAVTNVISGSINDGTSGAIFALTKTGSGALVLSGTNTYSGPTTVSAGKLEIGGTGCLGSGGAYSGAITNTTTIVCSSSATQTWSGVISGTGKLISNGSGTLLLAGVNTYSGATTVSNGLVLGVTGGSCASAITVTNTPGSVSGMGVSVTNSSLQWTCPSVTFKTNGVGAQLKFSFSVNPSTTVAPLNITGNLDFSGGVPAVVVSASSNPSPGTYPLLVVGGTAPATVPALSGIDGTLAWAGSGNKTLYLTIVGGGTMFIFE